MRFYHKHRWLLWTIVAILVLVPVLMLFHLKLVVIANYYFLLGLAMLLVAIVLILSHARLFAGWPKLFRGLMGRQRSVDEKEIEKQERVDRRHVASEQKNGPIVVSSVTQFCLWVALVLMFLGVVLTFKIGN